MDYINEIASLSSSNKSKLATRLNELKEFEQADKVQSIVNNLHITLSDKDHFNLIYGIISQLNLLEQYDKVFSHPVYINRFKDKKGNIFLQARTSVKEPSGKLKWINAYVGAIKDFPNGEKDPLAYEKGEAQIRIKLLSHYFPKTNT